jgi:hypothetical protein
MSRRLALGALAAAALAVAAFHNVPTAVTPDDRTYADRILAAAGGGETLATLGARAGFEDEIRAIVAVQDAVLKTAPVEEAIPFGREREPKDLFELRHGQCFDRSRVIEKILGVLGFETRHIAVYAIDGSVLGALLAPRTPSHALTEVRTAKGWLPVDSNVRWIGLDMQRVPVPLSAMHGARAGSIEWAAESKSPVNAIFKRPFAAIRGLYSRHGQFYPPYTPLPDVNFGELLENFGA